MHVYRPEHSIIQAPSDVLDRTELKSNRFFGGRGLVALINLNLRAEFY